MFRSMFKTYGSFASKHPFIMLGIVALLTLGSLKAASTLQTRGTAFSKMFPKDIEVIKAFNLVQDEFIGTSSITIAVEADPEDAGSASFNDVREPSVIKYMEMLAKKSEDVENVISASSAADIVKKANNGIIPDSKETIISSLKSSPQSSSYISKDYTMGLVRISLGNVEEKEEKLIAGIREVVSTTTAPPGIKAGITGEPTLAVVFKEYTGPDMQRTSMYSFIGILIIAFLVFASVKHGIMPLLSMMLGLTWTFGLIGVLGIKISSTMAGFASMVMGIGIDFGIQIVSRYREELAGMFKHSSHETPEEALAYTLESVIGPMSTTTLSALVGFQAMSLGELTMMADLGKVMSLGVLSSMLAAITLVPSLLMLTEKIWGEKNEK